MGQKHGRQENISADDSVLPDRVARQLRAIGVGSFFRLRDLAPAGLTSARLQALLDSGAAERVTRGLYRLTDSEPTEHHTLAAICARVPIAIVCLLSALRVHEIGTQLPREAWIAIPHKARAPQLPGLPVRLIRFSGPSLGYGIETRAIEGVPVRVTNAARTVVDCFRFRRLVGRDVALEALREVLREKQVSRDELARVAEMCRARSLVGPYLEALT
jgi:predicted transcriptional regulator of viral defense system